MEISIDVGKHVVDEIQNIALSENKDFDIISSKILELGLRIYQSVYSGRIRTPNPETFEHQIWL